MRTKQRLFWASVVAASILLAACTATKFTAVWIDETYQVNPVKILVIGMSNTPATKRLFEDEFVKELQDRGTDAVAGYTVLPDQPLVDIGAILAKAAEVGADTVLITKPIGRRTGTTASPWATYEDQYVDTQTNLYDVKSGKMIWTATSETWIMNYASNKTQIRSFVKVIVKELSKQKVLKSAVSDTRNTG
jgi:uncharacterized membrane protein